MSFTPRANIMNLGLFGENEVYYYATAEWVVQIIT